MSGYFPFHTGLQVGTSLLQIQISEIVTFSIFSLNAKLGELGHVSDKRSFYWIFAFLDEILVSKKSPISWKIDEDVSTVTKCSFLHWIVM